MNSEEINAVWNRVRETARTRKSEEVRYDDEVTSGDGVGTTAVTDAIQGSEHRNISHSTFQALQQAVGFFKLWIPIRTSKHFTFHIPSISSDEENISNNETENQPTDWPTDWQTDWRPARRNST
eukprot:Selendium_serpulae@DN5989_c1_g1_i9.p4